MKHKTITATALLALAALVPASADNLADEVLRDNAARYTERIDRIVGVFLADGTPAYTEDLARLQTFEFHFLSSARLDPHLIDRLPPLLLSQIEVRDPRNAPGQLLVARAEAAGLNLRRDRIRGKAFRLYVPASDAG